MEIKLMFGVFCFLFVYATAQQNGGGAVKFEEGDNSDIKTLFSTMNKTPDDSESGDGSGDDDTEIYSGSGSGEPEEDTATEKPTPKPTSKAKTKETTTKEPESTVMLINEVEPTKKEKVKESTDNDIVVDEPTEDPKNSVGASRSNQKKKTTGDEAGVDFTVGIIIGVVVGAILAILVIVFLVYRLRKKDEGSYSLDEPSSQAFIKDEKNGGGQGKEYFA